MPCLLCTAGGSNVGDRAAVVFCYGGGFSARRRIIRGRNRSAWRPRSGSMINHRALTSAIIAARERADAQLLAPASRPTLPTRPIGLASRYGASTSRPKPRPPPKARLARSDQTLRCSHRTAEFSFSAAPPAPYRDHGRAWSCCRGWSIKTRSRTPQWPFDGLMRTRCADERINPA